MKNKIISFLSAYLLSPVLITVGVIISSFLSSILPIYVLPIIFVILSWGYITYKSKEEDLIKLIVPHFWVFCLYMIGWVITFGLAAYRTTSQYLLPFYIMSFPYTIINVLISFMGNDIGLLILIISSVFVVEVVSVLIGFVLSKKKVIIDKKLIVYAFILIGLTSICLYQFYDRGNTILTVDHQIDKVEDEVDLYDYFPFYQYNKLKTLDEKATISITDNYPKLDGATAAFPVYGAVVQEIYKGLYENNVGDYVSCNKTGYAYERLINGEIDIFFGAQPSSQQITAAKEKGVKFELTPIAKEAFVFFVNSDNPIESLTLEQIQDIYLKKITNWKELGGKDEKIMPFQRPINSGSQTIMVSKVMNGIDLPNPLWEEYAGGMGEVISRVASYRNYSSSIGYSFRFYATGMKSNDKIKLIAIDGIEPTIENIQNGTYPFTIEVYAVTAGSTNENTQILIDWITSEQGQGFIEKCGYVKK